MNEKIFDKRQKNHRVLRRLVVAGSLLAEHARATNLQNPDLIGIWERAVEDLRAAMSDEVKPVRTQQEVQP